jgi:hypothetical protein
MSSTTPEVLTAEAARELQAFIDKTERTDEQIRRRIESLEVSADLKALLSDLLRMATRVGEIVLRIGRKILDFVLTLARHFPTLTFAVVIASVLTMLVAMVPVVGALLASVIGPLMYAVGVGGATALEVRSRDFRQRVEEFAAGFKTQST